MTSSSSGIDEMIDRVRRGSVDARGRLLERYRPYLRILAERAVGPVLRQRSDSSDIVQQTYLDAIRDMEAFRGTTEAEFSAWISQILSRNVANLVRDHRAAKRDIRRDQPLDPHGSASITWFQPASNQPTPIQIVMRGEAALRVAGILDVLPSDQREAVKLRHLEGWSLIEIAKHLDRSTSAVAGLIKRGLQGLRQRISENSLG